MELKEKQYDIAEDIHRVLQDVLKRLAENYFQLCFQVLKLHGTNASLQQAKTLKKIKSVFIFL